MQSILELLATSQGLKSEVSNIALAGEIAKSVNADAINVLVVNLKNKDKNIQSDCIKTLYETGYLKPELIAGYYQDFLALLASKNNRLVWGGMIALSTIADLKHREIFSSIDKILDCVEKGSVITIDCGVEILARLNKHNDYTSIIEPLLVNQLLKCPIKQLPMYIEKCLISIGKENKEIYQNIIEIRKPECDKDSQIKRLDKSLTQIKLIK